jgi:hypothetical protein
MKKNVLFVALSLLLIHSSNAADSASNATAARNAVSAESRAQLVARAQQRIKRIDAALASVKWDVAVTPAMKYSDAQRKAENEFNSWMNKMRTKLQTLRSDIERAAASKDYSASVKVLRDAGESDAAVQAMIHETMDQSRRSQQMLSNASKARHEALLAAIRNIRG